MQIKSCVHFGSLKGTFNWCGYISEGVIKQDFSDIYKVPLSRFMKRQSRFYKTMPYPLLYFPHDPETYLQSCTPKGLNVDFLLCSLSFSLGPNTTCKKTGQKPELYKCVIMGKFVISCLLSAIFYLCLLRIVLIAWLQKIKSTKKYTCSFQKKLHWCYYHGLPKRLL